jgi:hypothetical protein
VAEKVSLCLGSDFWHTASVERLGIPRIMVSDGPHGLRAQLEEAEGFDAVLARWRVESAEAVERFLDGL